MYQEITSPVCMSIKIMVLFLRCLCYSYELIPFTKLGWKNDQGAWLFMLGAVTGGTVDLGLDNVVITPDRYSDMFFTLPIVQSMYVHSLTC
jgi:hypothetical protein